MAARAARELRDGDYVNLGIGLPADSRPRACPSSQVTLHAENGIWVSDVPHDDGGPGDQRR